MAWEYESQKENWKWSASWRACRFWPYSRISKRELKDKHIRLIRNCTARAANLKKRIESSSRRLPPSLVSRSRISKRELKGHSSLTPKRARKTLMNLKKRIESLSPPLPATATYLRRISKRELKVLPCSLSSTTLIGIESQKENWKHGTDTPWPADLDRNLKKRIESWPATRGSGPAERYRNLKKRIERIPVVAGWLFHLRRHWESQKENWKRTPWMRRSPRDKHYESQKENWKTLTHPPSLFKKAAPRISKRELKAKMGRVEEFTRFTGESQKENWKYAVDGLAEATSIT